MDAPPQPLTSGTGVRPADPPDDDSPPPDDLPACLSCRKRKSRCSRETPSCAQCIRLGCECLYVSKQKPGLKAGVVDTLSRRLEFLERLFLDSTGNKKPHLAFLDLDIGQLPSPFTPGLAGAGGPSSGHARLSAYAHAGGVSGGAGANGNGNSSASSPESSASNHGRSRQRSGVSQSRKRRRLDQNGSGGDDADGDDDDDDDDDNENHQGASRAGHGRPQYLFLDDPPYHHRRRARRNGDHDISDDDDSNASSSSLDHAWIPPLPALPLLKAIVEAHFQTVHHWVPILHPTRFRALLDDPRERRRRAVLIHAIIAMSIKYVDFGPFGLKSRHVARQIRLSRRAVQLNALDGLSFINTQALIFLAFDYMGSGLIAKAWPIVAALTREVVFLQLTVEPDDAFARPTPLVKPGALFDGARDWTEAEERRRIFWGVFFLDRISSISAGGGFWAREETVTTPYFALWDSRENEGGGKAIGSMAAPSTITTAFHQSPEYYYGNTHHPMASPVTARDGTTSSGPSATSGGGGGGGSSSSAPAANTNKLGALAYCIEATEHLSHVSAFYARQPPPAPSLGETVTASGAGAGVGAEDRAAMNAWLTRFKELDLRLVHWKMHLPPQWSDWHVSLKIDPNLTLSHLSHLASMILLHQHIAYPPPQWSSLVRPSLPSVCSAETCEQAVADMVAISQKYLRYVGGLACGQFAFCLFVAARFVLVHGHISRTALPGGGGGTTTSGVPTLSSTSSSSADDTPPSFFALLESLDNISVRWNGYCVPDEEESGDSMNNMTGEQSRDNDGAPPPADETKRWRQPLDLAALYAARLRSLHQKATAIGADINTPLLAVDEMIALLSTSTMEGLFKIKPSPNAHDALDTAAAVGVAASTSTPSGLSSSAASHLRSPSVIHGGGVEIASILQNPVPASVASRTPAMTPMPAMTSAGPLTSPVNNGPDASIMGYGSMRGGPVSANVSNVRMVPGTPATAANVFNMDMVAQQHPHHQHPLHHQHQQQQQHPHQQHQHQPPPQHPHQHPPQPPPPQYPQHPQHTQQPQQHQQQQQPGIDEEDEFAAMSHLLLGNQFLDMERVMMRNDASFLLR
ncbi:hypothetical protein SPBR_00087 [Sporothrix brasiliensis 5110]|uniref:Zn(2)-C6 fungal-type domain-containing protein n=1 Tax=Sporothrix brasiliensis 5110 TaxID=1398154 RepID=A0A0C2J138_9PEZI|nr:uncharacterized protein SPBR_00087 [Sporothrix brasiliensis 5110]KIH90842.1 hypothetical protein SPBR_00087 [Sporothrix brasiliensis 5110]